ncbi:hypothetical protein HDU98_007222 [Podochytrium sp. JEL0797]|nr:hypothetical protein HDU98_007222 [Podochytrium sp. JEL0797]
MSARIILPTPLYAAPPPLKVSGGFVCPSHGGHGGGSRRASRHAPSSTASSTSCGKTFDSTHAYKTHFHHEHLGVKWQRYHDPSTSTCQYCGVKCGKNIPRHFILHHADPALGGYKQLGIAMKTEPTLDDLRILDVLNTHPMAAPSGHPPCESCDAQGLTCGKYRPCWRCVHSGSAHTCDPAFTASQPQYAPFVFPTQSAFVEPPAQPMKTRARSESHNGTSVQPQHASKGEHHHNNHLSTAGDHQEPPWKSLRAPPSRKPAQLRKYLKSLPDLRPCPFTKLHSKLQKHVCPWTDEDSSGNGSTRCGEAFALSCNLKVHYYAEHHGIYIQKYHPAAMSELTQEPAGLLATCPVCELKQLPEDLNMHWILEHVDKALNGVDLDGKPLQNQSASSFSADEIMVLRVLGGFGWQRHGADEAESGVDDDDETVGVVCGSEEGCGGMCGWFGGRVDKLTGETKAFVKSLNLPMHHSSLGFGIDAASPSLPLDDEVTSFAALSHPGTPRGFDDSSDEAVTPSDVMDYELDDFRVELLAHPPSPEIPRSTASSVSSRRKRSFAESNHPSDNIVYNYSSSSVTATSSSAVSPTLPASSSASRRSTRSQRVTPPSSNQMSHAPLPKLHIRVPPPASPAPEFTAPMRKIKLMIPREHAPHQLPYDSHDTSTEDGKVIPRRFKYKCSFCLYQCDSKELLHTHERSHATEMEPKLQCPHCPKLLKRPCDLQRHVVVHPEYHERPAHAPQPASKPARIVVAHPVVKKQGHATYPAKRTEKPSVCEGCGFVFSRHDALVRHEKQNKCRGI